MHQRVNVLQRSTHSSCCMCSRLTVNLRKPWRQNIIFRLKNKRRFTFFPYMDFNHFRLIFTEMFNRGLMTNERPGAQRVPFFLFFYAVSFRQLRHRRLVSSYSERTLKSIDYQQFLYTTTTQQLGTFSALELQLKRSYGGEMIHLLTHWFFYEGGFYLCKHSYMYSTWICLNRYPPHTHTQRLGSGLPSFQKITIKQDVQVNVY